MTSILADGLNEELKKPVVPIKVQQVFDNALCNLVTKQTGGKSRTVGAAKNLLEFYDLVGQAVEDLQKKSGISEIDKVNFTEEDPDVDSNSENIVFSVASRDPGAFGQGPPGNPTHRNLRPMFREEGDDPVNPGYRIMTVGYWYDNVIRFTCWARTNKAANSRAQWFEDLMEEYNWWFKYSGVDRVLFSGRRSDIVVTVDSNKWYGRPLDYFVRTEKIRVFSEKTIEEILVNYKVNLRT